MRMSRMTVIGLLICLTCIYFTSDIWLKTAFAVFGGYGFPVGIIVTLIGLFKKEKN